MKIAIVGAGIAGLALCEYLAVTEHTITLVDSNDSLMASQAPTMLFHPFPGRSLEPHPLLHQAVANAVELLQRWKKIAPESVRSQKIVRPIRSKDRLWNSFDRHWRSTSAKWATVALRSEEMDEFSCFSQGIHDGVLVCQPSYAIDMKLLRKALINNLQHRGVRYKKAKITHLTRQHNGIALHPEETFDRIVLALGAATLDWFPDAHLTNQGGSLLKIPFSEALPYLLSINGLHLGAHQDGDWVIGSTRWSRQPESSVEQEALLARLSPLCQATPTTPNGEVWSGIRCIYPSDRLPLCGELPHKKNVFVLTALGSKGLLWGPIAAKHVMRKLCFGVPIVPDLSLLRANNNDGWFSPRIF